MANTAARFIKKAAKKTAEQDKTTSD